MVELDPRDRLKVMVAADTDPVLSDDEIDTLLMQYAYATNNSLWVNTTVYALGDIVVPSPRNGHYYKVTAAGTSGDRQPSFPMSTHGTVSDGTVVWTEVATEPAYNLNRAAAEGWTWKAGKVANRYNMSDGVQRLNRSDLYKHCMLMVKRYSGRSIQSIQVTGGYTGTADPVIGNLNVG